MQQDAPLFPTAPNLSVPDLALGEPWNFIPADEPLAKLRALDKEARRKWTLQPEAKWNVYSAVVGLNPSKRISAANPARALHGFVADFDSKHTVDEVLKHLEVLRPEFLPTYIEISLGLKIRLVWRFVARLMTMGSEHAALLLKAFADKFGARTLLAGFDENSLKPAEVWTNGGRWQDIGAGRPVPWEVVMGVALTVGNNTSLYGHEEIPIETIAARVAELYPGRWEGEFKLDAQGVRFWDKNADNPTGCQVKPDGMLCFTGPVPFMNWNEIFTKGWCDAQRVLVLGNAAKGIYTDTRDYWTEINGSWKRRSRTDILLELGNRGLSDKIPKGDTISDAGRVLHHIQNQQAVDFAAPLINSPPGIVNIGAKRYLNTVKLNFLQPAPADECTGDWSIDCPDLMFFREMFVGPDAFEYAMAWLQRRYLAFLNYERIFSQALFFCGPRQNGKTLLLTRVFCPMFGGVMANPFANMVGDTDFNSECFEAGLLAINDEEAPRDAQDRHRFVQRLKSWVVNGEQTFHQKFRDKSTITWLGAFCVTLNDDAGSIGMLPEVDPSTRDKMMFFRTKARETPWGDSRKLESGIHTQLPRFCRIVHDWKPRPDILIPDRFGLLSYYDPTIERLAGAQGPEQNFLEILQKWGETDYWQLDNDRGAWRGNPSDLHSLLSTYETLKVLLDGWKANHIHKSLTALSRRKNLGVNYLGIDREFEILREATEKPSL
jgi:hypothetical protein